MVVALDVLQRGQEAGTEPEDAELVRRYQAGELEAANLLLARHAPALRSLCRALAREDAEDVEQETLERAFSHLPQLRVGASFRPWLLSIARRLACDSHRRRRHLCPLPAHECPVLACQDEDLGALEREEERQAVTVALNRLRDRQQQVLLLREVEGLSYLAIAQRLAISEAAVETLLFRARRNLRAAYEHATA